MVDDVHQHLPTRHGAVAPADELEAHRLGERGLGDAVRPAHVPGVDFLLRAAQLGQRRMLRGVARGVAVLAAFEEGIALAARALPLPAVATGRPGAAFVVAHAGRSMLYVVLGWWDHENELPLRVWVRPAGEEGTWRPAEGSESFCVWDLQVLWFEREAYVATVLAEGHPDPVRAYLARHLVVEPAAADA